jgi:hypothetical protein
MKLGTKLLLVTMVDLAFTAYVFRPRRLRPTSVPSRPPPAWPPPQQGPTTDLRR